MALLLMVAGGASAQSGRTIFVDANGGDDSNNGQSATIGAGVNGPVASIQRAVELARADAAGNTISIEAGFYDAEVEIRNAGTATNLNNLTFLARPDQDGNTEVNLIVDRDQDEDSADSDADSDGDDDDVFLTAVSGFTFAAEGGAEFIFQDEDGDTDNGTLDFQAGSVNFGSGIVTIDGVGTVERTNAAVSGTVQYDALPGTIRFNGDASTSAGTLLPATVDSADEDVLIEIALGSVATPVNDAARTFTLGTGGLTLGDDGGAVTLDVRDGNAIAGTITTVDGSGANGTAAVVIQGEGSIGDLDVNGAVTEYDLDEADAADGGDADSAIDADNSAASIDVLAGELNFDGDADTERYLVTGDFRHTGGVVTADDEDGTILVVQGDFRRTANVAGNFEAINVYLEGTEDADFAPGTSLTLNSVHINRTPDPGTGSTATKMVLFLQDITVNSGATVELAAQDGDNIIPFIVTGDAEVDLNGNLVNVTNGGRSLVNGTVSDTGNSGAVRFTDGGIASGTGVYSSILVSGPDITAEDEFEFTGALLLLDGGINVEDDGDISPLGDEASVVVNIAALGDPTIEGDMATAVATRGTFNALERRYDLIYQDNEQQDVAEFEAGNEFDTNFVRDLTVDVTDSAVIANEDVAGDGTISGDLIVRDGREADGATDATNPDEFGVLRLDGVDLTVAGTTTVEAFARITLGDDDADTTTPDVEGSLTVTGDGNVVRGEIVSDDTDINDEADEGVLVLGVDASVNGDGGAQSLLGNVRLADNANATITDIRRIIGTIADVDADAGIESTLTLGLRTEAPAAAVTGLTNAGNVVGAAILDASNLTLTTDVEFNGDVTVGGALALGENDLVFNDNDGIDDGDGDDLRLGGDVTATTGAIQIAGDDGDGDTPNFFGNNAIVPNLGFFVDTDLTSSVRVSDLLRIYAEIEDGTVVNNPSTPANEDVTVTLLEGATIALGDGGELEDDADDDDELVIAGAFSFRNEQDGTFTADAFELLTSDDITGLVIAPATNFGMFGVPNNAPTEVTSLPEVGEDAPDYVPTGAQFANGDLRQQTFTVDSLAVENGSFNLAGHIVAVTGDVTFRTDRPLLNAQNEDDDLNDGDVEVDDLGDLDADGANDDGDDDTPINPTDGDLDNITVDLRSSDENPFSALRFIGSENAVLMIDADEDNDAERLFVGDGIDIVIAKGGASGADDADEFASVTLMGGALLFDDAFDSFGDADDEFNEDTFDDEYLVLESGILVAGDIARPSEVYVRLDHENRLSEVNPLGGAQVLVGATSDAGQGFVFDETEDPGDVSSLEPQFPDSYINGNVRKRIISVQSDNPDSRRNPGNVIYPVGDMSGNYAEYVLDFESIAQDQNFGLTSINVAFANESPGGSLGIPIDSDGDDVNEVEFIGDFYWLVTASPRLGANTFFSVQARFDGYELQENVTIDELVLVRRQFGNADTNEYTLVEGEYDNFLLQDEDASGDPVVVAQNVEALLGPQGTIFTFGGSEAFSTPTGPEPVTGLPTVFEFKGSSPNPFRGQTTLAFDLPQASEVTLAVYDVMGRQVMSLDAGTMTPGADQTIAIDGSRLASGVYVFRLTAVGADNSVETRSGQITLAR